MTDGPQELYRVITPGVIIEKIKRAGDLATDLGLRQMFLANLKAIQRGLAQAPLTWGDPQYGFGSTRPLLAYQRVLGDFAINYVVDEARRLVWVQSVRILPFSPLVPYWPADDP